MGKSHVIDWFNMKKHPFFHWWSQVWRNNALKVGDSLVLTKPFRGGTRDPHGHPRSPFVAWSWSHIPYLSLSRYDDYDDYDIMMIHIMLYLIAMIHICMMIMIRT